MIRRSVGREFWLITQHDHALLAGELARQVGNKLFDPLKPNAILGVAQHDCGWPVHDDQPTLNGAGQPIDVFESTRAIALEVWQASVDRAAAQDPYAGLLASLHALSLSVFATSATSQDHEKFSMTHAKSKFEINRFQHKQIETQETLRKQLNLPTDLPMRGGLVEDPQGHRAELQLQFDFRMLQAMDQISLALCCTEPPGTEIKPVLVAPGGRSVVLKLTRSNITALNVSPWPFREDRIEVSTTARRVPGETFGDVASFREIYAVAPVETLQFRLES